MPELDNTNVTATESGDGRVSQAAPREQLYWIKRFSLYKYISLRLGVIKPHHSLFEIESTILRAVALESLYDDRNPKVIVCSAELSDALDLPALHRAELRSHLLNKFLVIVDTGTGQSQDMLPPVIQFHCGKIHSIGTPMPINLTRDFGVNASFESAPRPDKDATFKLTERFLYFIRNHTLVDQDKTIFTFDEICHLLQSYILSDKQKYFDMRNIRICIVKDDPLGDALNVSYFHRSQIVLLLRQQLIPFMEADESSSDDSLLSDDEGRLIIDI